MIYVYILESLKDKSHYVGVTENLKQRLIDHNTGSAKYSTSKRPYKLVWYSAFLNKRKALIFEKYLKNGSGFSFRNKHFL